MDASTELRRRDPAAHLREQDKRPERFCGGGTWDESWTPSDPAEAAVWARLPIGTYAAVSYDQATDVPGFTALRLRKALFWLVMTRKARAWEEYPAEFDGRGQMIKPAIHLVARGPFRQCDHCGAYCAPGPCRVCAFDPTARQEAA